MTTNPEVSEAVRRRADLIAGLDTFMAKLKARPDGAPVPVVTASYRIPAGPRGEQIAWLDELAEVLGTEVTENGMGSLIAGCDYGPVRERACVSPEDRGTTAYFARAAALRDAQAGAQA
jgi:hypothetical protein